MRRDTLLRILATCVVCLAALATVDGCTDYSPALGETARAVESGASITSDQPDYAPGDTALLSGEGWAAEEDVALTIECTCGCIDEITAHSDAGGTFTTAYDITEQHLGATCNVTAVGQTSGYTAQTSFTDGNVRVFAGPTGTSFTLTYAQYSSTSCTGAIAIQGNTPQQGTRTVVAGTSSNFSVAVGESVKLTAAATSDQGGAFSAWTSQDPFSLFGGPSTLCIVGFSGNGNRQYTATYSAANHAPTVTCKNITVATTPQTCAAAGSVIAGTSDPDGDTVTCTASPSGSYQLGSTTVSVSCTDGHGGTASCSGTVTLVDDDAPTINCPSPGPVECTSPSGASVSYAVPTASDNCGGTVTANCTPASGGTFAVGSTTGQCTATDTSGNSSQCSFAIVVKDTTPPTISCPVPSSAECTGNHAANVDPGHATGADLCGGVAISGPGAGSFPLGTTSIAFVATDDAGLKSACASSVTVSDTLPPTISCPAPTVAECTGNHAANVDPGHATGADVCGGVSISGPGPGSFPLGTTSLAFVATDDVGHQVACGSSVIVADTTPPAITCPAPVTAECTGAHSATVDLGAASASDVCGGVTVNDPAPQAFPLGTTSVAETATDDVGNTSSCATSVTIADTTPPTITCPAPVTVECTGNGAATVDVAGGTASDVCGDVTVTDPSAQPYPLGTTTVAETATDEVGLHASCTTAVTVVDTTPPTFGPVASQTVLGSCNGTPVTFTAPTATDGCQTATVTCTPIPGNSFGLNTVTCTATDPSGNSATTSFTVNVIQPLRVVFLAPLADDNVADDISTDADVANVFQVKSTIPHQVHLLSCGGADVTTSVSVTVNIAVTLKDGAGVQPDTNVVPNAVGIGDAGGVMALVDGKYKYNLKTTGYVSGTANSSLYFDSVVKVSYTSAPSIIVGQEDVRLESK